jgi:hypothetical protein
MLMHVLVTMAAVSMIFGFMDDFDWLAFSPHIGCGRSEKNHSFRMAILIAGVLAALLVFQCYSIFQQALLGVSTFAWGFNPADWYFFSPICFRKKECCRKD